MAAIAASQDRGDRGDGLLYSVAMALQSPALSQGNTTGSLAVACGISKLVRIWASSRQRRTAGLRAGSAELTKLAAKKVKKDW